MLWGEPLLNGYNIYSTYVGVAYSDQYLLVTIIAIIMVLSKPDPNACPQPHLRLPPEGSHFIISLSCIFHISLSTGLLFLCITSILSHLENKNKKTNKHLLPQLCFLSPSHTPAFFLCFASSSLEASLTLLRPLSFLLWMYHIMVSTLHILLFKSYL